MIRILSISILVLAISCSHISENDQALKKIESNKSEAIELHDELMAKMGELKLLHKKLEHLIVDSVEVESNSNIELAIAQIDIADKSMWDWMHNFDVAYQADKDSLTLIYFKSKLETITEVNVLFDSAIYHSNQLLK